MAGLDRKSLDKVGLEFIEGLAGADNNVPAILQQYSAQELKDMERKLVRKIDLRSLPILIILFLLNILDRNAIANARLGGLETTVSPSSIRVVQ